MPQADRVLQELGRIGSFYPILRRIGDRLAVDRPFEGRTVALHLHLTTLTAALVQELILGGGRWILSAANPATTDPGVVELLRDRDITVWSGRSTSDGLEETLNAAPDLFADVGFALGAALQRRQPPGARPAVAGVEISRSGVNRLRTLDLASPLAFPVVNIDGGQLKPAIECRHGVGEGLWQAFTALTGVHLAGRRVSVVGYGAVGTGVAAYARAAGASVTVIDRDPIRQLIAQYDGHRTSGTGRDALPEAFADARIVVTATGSRHALSLDDIRHLPDGAILLNAGHHNDEIDVLGLTRDAQEVDQVGTHLHRYRVDGRWRSVLAAGNPLNIVLNSGSQEPVLLHFTVLALTLDWLSRQQLAPGEHRVPLHIEQEAARFALQVR